MSIGKDTVHSKLAVFTRSVSSEVTAARLAVSDGNRPYAGRLLCRVLTRVIDHQQRPAWYPVARELFELHCAIETAGKRLRVPAELSTPNRRS